MRQKNWLALMLKQTQLTQILEINQYTEKLGLVLNKEDAELLTEESVDFGQGILPKIIFE